MHLRFISHFLSGGGWWKGVLGNPFPGADAVVLRTPGPKEILLPFVLPDRPGALIDPWWPWLEVRDVAILGSHWLGGEERLAVIPEIQSSFGIRGNS